MSEKRFKRGINLSCIDTETGKSYWYACNLCGLLNKQQATIRKLQDLCGESDSENAKLRIENEQLEKGKMEALSLLGEEIDKNEQLRKELNDCEKFRYTVFQRMGDVLDE